MKGGGQSLRERAEELVRAAADAGMDGAWKLLCLTPREIETAFRAAAARRRLELELADAAAWLAGRYVLAAVHAPRRYPRRPDGAVRRPREMDADEMKRVFAAMAAQRRENGGS